MKKLQYIKTIGLSLLTLVLAVSLSNCSTENEDELVEAFFEPDDSDNPLKNYNYYNLSQIDNIYTAPMTASDPKVLWREGRNYLSDITYINGHIKALARQSYKYASQYGIEYRDSRNFQIECNIETDLAYYEDNSGNIGRAGFYFNTDENSEKGYAVFIIAKKDVTEAFIRVEDLSKKKTLKEMRTISPVNTNWLLTVRKVGEKIAFFYNKRKIVSTTYTPNNEKRLGHSISQNSSLTIKKVTAGYLP